MCLCLSFVILERICISAKTSAQNTVASGASVASCADLLLAGHGEERLRDESKEGLRRRLARRKLETILTIKY